MLPRAPAGDTIVTAPFKNLQVWRGATLATCDRDLAGCGVIGDGAVVAEEGRIIWVGPSGSLPSDLLRRATKVEDVEGRLITPGLIDAHTHLVFGGDRAAEWGLRLSGAPYEEIARKGGGIVSTVTATRAASEDDLVTQSLPRLDALLADGVTTVEIKSGYGLNLADETKMLRAARRLGELRRVRVRTTLLAAHTLPPEHRANRTAYVQEIVGSIIPAVAAAGLADAVDAFCEGIAFTADETRVVFSAAQAHGLPVKLHADQLSDGGGAALAAEFDALSADHLEHASDAGLMAMQHSGVVAMLLPGAYYVLKETKRPPTERMRELGLTMAVATDLNPGTSPVAGLRLAMHLACTLFGLSPEEAFLGVTRHAAKALGLAGEIGQIRVGMACDLAIWDADRIEPIIYWLGRHPACRTVLSGQDALGQAV